MHRVFGFVRHVELPRVNVLGYAMHVLRYDMHVLI